jgi:hypothetical protein
VKRKPRRSRTPLTQEEAAVQMQRRAAVRKENTRIQNEMSKKASKAHGTRLGAPPERGGGLGLGTGASEDMDMEM